MHAYAIQDSRGMVAGRHGEPAPGYRRLQQELGERLAAVALNRYPGERVNELRSALAGHARMPAGFDLMRATARTN